MKSLTTLLLPIGLGVAAAAMNFYSLNSVLRPVEFITVSEDLTAGHVIAEKDLAPVETPAKLSKDLKYAAPTYKNRSMLIGQRLLRDVSAGSLVFYKDTDVAEIGADVDFRSPSEAGLTVWLGKNRASSADLRVGMEVYFRVIVIAEDGTSKTVGEPGLGPFRLIAVGGQQGLGGDEARSVSQVTVAIDLDNPKPQHRQLEQFLDAWLEKRAQDPRIIPVR